MESTTILLRAVLGLLLVVMVLLIVLLAKNRRLGTQSSPLWLQQLVEALDGGMESLENELQQQSLAGQTELLRTLQAVNESLQGTLSNAAQQQMMRLGAVQEQSFQSNQAQEMRQHRLHQMTEESLGRFEQRVHGVESRLEAMRQTLEGGLQQVRAENSQKLEEMRLTVDEKLHDQLDKRLSESFGQVSRRLEQVYQSLGEIHTLTAGVGDLKKMLGNVKTRGIWGEMQLEALLTEALTANQFAKNVVIKPGSQERVEFAICLPGREEGTNTPVFLPIDSKFPQEDYVRLVEASQQGEPRAVEGARKALLNTVRTEARRIGDKYIEPPYSTDFAVMFLPLESLYAEVVRHGDAVEQMQREHRVVLAGPSTLLALLNSLQMGFRTLAIERRSAEVWKLLGAVKSDFGNFAQVLQRTQEKLQQASESIDTAFVRTRSIERKLRRVESLDDNETERLLGAGEEKQ